jgi:Holliday junction resolvase
MRAAKVDANQPDIVGAFRRLGFSVAVTSKMGDGFPDLVVGRRGHNLLIEIKDGSKIPSKRQLTPAQEEFHRAWRGRIRIVERIEDVIKIANDTDLPV